MNSRERLMSVLTGNKPDRIPWAPLIDHYYINSLPEQDLVMNEIETIRYIKGDILLRHVNIYKENRKNVDYRVTRSGDDELRVLVTPVGEVNSRYKYSGKTCYQEEAYIKTVEDLKVMQYIAEHTELEADYERFTETDKIIGGDGLASPSTPSSPIQQLLMFDMGIENFTYLLYDYPDEVEEYLQVFHNLNLNIYRLAAQSPSSMKVFIAYENTSTTVMGPSWYNKYCGSCLDEYADIMHQGGKIFITHMCGKLKGLSSEIGSGKMDGIDSVCPPTTWDLWAHEALEKMPGKIIIGGLEPSSLKRMTAEETKAYTRKAIERCEQKHRLILCTGDATSYGTPIENLKAVTDVVKEMGAL